MAESKTDSVERNASHHGKNFLMLGHDHGSYYYLPSGSKQVVALTVAEHIESRLIGLAPDENFWRKNYGTEHGISWRLARQDLLSRQHMAGIYDPSRIRGRGAWWDSNQAVLHLGDKLIINGENHHLSDSRKYIYEAMSPISLSHTNPLSCAEAKAVSRICDLISWERPINSRYLAGWCAIAPICGALDWRPHIYLTGSRGTGKTYIVDKVIRRLIGDIGLAVQSATTEAGLRQTLRHDSRPVMFDEIEGEDPRAQLRIQNILELARQASSETGAAIVKGSATGEPTTFRIRSCFAFSSITYAVTSSPDASRVSVLGLEVDHNQERFSRLAALIAGTLTDEYVSRFLARSIHMIPTIRENARRFAAATASVLGSQRAGDQIGALLSGAYSLHSDGIITPEAAVDWVRTQDWSEQRGINEDTDEMKCLNRILQHVIRAQTKHGPVDRSVAELVGVASSDSQDEVLSVRSAEDILGRNGIRGEDGLIFISVSHNALSDILKGTPWAKNWSRILRRLPGATSTPNPVRFRATRSRAVAIPYQEREETREEAEVQEEIFV